eukprot:TRINITY_DN12828_c0_g4_i1.p1 TRINITY_DN12828_c0_g4~~TRINITY_DN12828_c0_g4_i1.p1  ORF type:complete len:216 (-),score=42.46 TRINITY_DN12828_c0_g4_i1:10-657(-)
MECTSNWVLPVIKPVLKGFNPRERRFGSSVRSNRNSRIKVGRLMKVYLPQFKKLGIRLRRKSGSSKMTNFAVMEDCLEIPFSTPRHAVLAETTIGYRGELEDHKELYYIKEEGTSSYTRLLGNKAKSYEMSQRHAKKRVYHTKSPREAKRTELEMIESLKRGRNLDSIVKYETENNEDMDKKHLFKPKKQKKSQVMLWVKCRGVRRNTQNPPIRD